MASARKMSNITSYNGPPCNINPCMNNGICIPILNKAECHCPYNFMGQHCEKRKTFFFVLNIRINVFRFFAFRLTQACVSANMFSWQFVLQVNLFRPAFYIECFVIGADHIDKDQPVKFEGNTFLNYPNEVQRRYALKIYLIINQEKLRSILRPFLFYWHELLQFLHPFKQFAVCTVFGLFKPITSFVLIFFA